MTRTTGVCDICGQPCGTAFVRCTDCNTRELDRLLARIRRPDTEETDK